MSEIINFFILGNGFRNRLLCYPCNHSQVLILLDDHESLFLIYILLCKNDAKRMLILTHQALWGGYWGTWSCINGCSNMAHQTFDYDCCFSDLNVRYLMTQTSTNQLAFIVRSSFSGIQVGQTLYADAVSLALHVTSDSTVQQDIQCKRLRKCNKYFDRSQDLMASWMFMLQICFWGQQHSTIACLQVPWTSQAQLWAAGCCIWADCTCYPTFQH